MAIEAGDTVTFEYTGRLDDGTVFDTSRESVAEESGLAEAQPDRKYEAPTVQIGAGQVIEGLEEKLVGMEEGEEATVTIPPEKAYGEWTEERVREHDAEEFSRMVDGQAFDEGAYVETSEGDLARIVHADDETVRIDFNHEMADETLEFDVEVVAVE